MENSLKEDFKPSWGVLIYFKFGNSPNAINYFTLKLDNSNPCPADCNVMTQSLINRIQKIGSESYTNFIMTGFNFIWIDVEIN
jgi:hypothetical protein